MPSAQKHKVPDQPNPNREASRLQRDASNFDFRLVTLLLVLVTRADMLKEYLDDGKPKDARNVPLALGDPTKWKTLRTLFEPAMLAEMLHLWELPQTQACVLHLLTLFATAKQRDAYDLDTCPNSFFVQALVVYSGQQTAQLNAAGARSAEGREN
jgi:hypothetical protein